jgi:hypothetical protein
MVAPWVMDELKTVDLHDKRLNRRLGKVLSQLSVRPTASIPAACGGLAEMMAAYRLFDNPKATFERILQGHIDATRQRVAQQAVVLLVQDTTELDWTRPEQQVEGAGPLDGDTRRGAFLHPLHAFTPDGTPLGTLQARTWARAEGVVCASLSRAQRAAIPIEAKESYRWIETLRQAQVEAGNCPGVHCVCLADSEADIYELLAEGMAAPPDVDWIVRACQDRALCPTPGRNAEPGRLREQVLSAPVLFAQTIHVRGRPAKVACEKRGRRQPRQSRSAVVEVRAGRVRLRPPSRPDRQLPVVELNAVLAREVGAPAGEEPVEWLLLTSLPIAELEQVRQVIEYYCVRWMIEVLFRVLKSGCRIEERRLEHIDRLQACLAVYLIVAWRTLCVCRLGRGCPEVSCEVLFEPAEWKPVWKMTRRAALPGTPPTLGEMVRLVAQLGGYVDRKGSGPPGPQTVWIGLQRMYDLAQCWRLFGPDASVVPKDV